MFNLKEFTEDLIELVREGRLIIYNPSTDEKITTDHIDTIYNEADGIKIVLNESEVMEKDGS